MKIINLEKDKHLEDIKTIWNEEYGFIFPLTTNLLERNLSNYDKESSFVAVVDDEIVGFIIGKIWDDEYIIKSYLNTSWISLIFVKKRFRKQGIGSLLLSKSVDRFKKLGKESVNLGRDYRNFFPGLPIDFAANRNWFINRGFSIEDQTFDLIHKVEKNNKLIIENKEDFVFRIATLNDKDAIINFINRIWPGRWTMEAIEYFDNGGDGSEYLICLNKQNEICGFSKVCKPTTTTPCMSFSLTWRDRFKALGGIGPLGVDPSYRRNHLGYDIVSSAVNYLIDVGASDIIIDWTSLLEFYRHMGFEVWKSYFYVSKTFN